MQHPSIKRRWTDTNKLRAYVNIFYANFKVLHQHSLKVREHYEKPIRKANNAQDLNMYLPNGNNMSDIVTLGNKTQAF